MIPVSYTHLGYVIMAMEDCGFSKKDIRRVVGQLYEVFDLNSVEDAKEKYHSSPYLSLIHIWQIIIVLVDVSPVL